LLQVCFAESRLLGSPGFKLGKLLLMFFDSGKFIVLLDILLHRVSYLPEDLLFLTPEFIISSLGSITLSSVYYVVLRCDTNGYNSPFNFRSLFLVCLNLLFELGVTTLCRSILLFLFV